MRRNYTKVIHQLCTVLLLVVASVFFNPAFQPTEWRQPSSILSNYVVIGTDVYFNDTPIKFADLNTFEVASNKLGSPTGYARDANRVFIDGQEIMNADPKSFEAVFDKKAKATVYSKDKTRVYSIADIGWEYDSATSVPNVDARSFEFLNEFWIKDRHHVYDAIGDVIDGADAASFRAIDGSQYGVDGAQAYFLSDAPAVRGSNPKTFVVLDIAASCGTSCIFDAYDDRHLYLQGKRVK